MKDTPVLIVGGGPVGLALACELGWRGIACTLVEQGDGRILTPKMNEVSIRTMEFCRRWGIAENVHNSPFPADFPLDVAFVTNLSGYELGRVVRPPRMAGNAEGPSPMRRQVCSQMWFDPILQKFARTFPHVVLRYGTRLEAFKQGETGVNAELIELESGRRDRISAAYMVGCDGGSSTVRQSLGIRLHGETIGHAIHMYFRAPKLLESCGCKPATFFFVLDRQGVWSNVRFIDPASDMWRLTLIDAGPDAKPDLIDRNRLLRRALGRSISVEWLDTSVWTRRSVVAERYSCGRVFLAGDSVHQLSPTGGLGMNTGIADAVDLGWKLAATQSGWGGEKLLQSYDAERPPIGMRATKMATEFHFDQDTNCPEIDLIDDDTPAGKCARKTVGETLVRSLGRQFRTTGLQIGYRYENSPICVPDGTPPEPDDPEKFAASTRPGARAPHAWLPDGRSTLDLFGRGFVLLQFGIDPPATNNIETAAADCHVPLETVAIVEPEIERLYQSRLVLVRPDGHVAWRGNEEPVNANVIIDKTRGAMGCYRATTLHPEYGST